MVFSVLPGFETKLVVVPLVSHADLSVEQTTKALINCKLKESYAQPFTL